MRIPIGVRSAHQTVVNTNGGKKIETPKTFKGSIRLGQLIFLPLLSLGNG